MSSTTSIGQKFGDQAVAGEYAGAETVLRFAGAATELEALRNGCAAFDLGWRGKLVVSGEDRVRWLNGMVTNNTRDLRQDFGNFNFLLNAQGRIQAELTAWMRGDFYVLESEAAQMAAIREFLDHYIIMDDVELGDISDKLISLGVAGPRAVEVLRKAGLLQSGEVQPGQLLDGSWNGIGYSLLRDPLEQRDWYELWLAPENFSAVWSALLAAGATPTGAEALEQQRILLGLPRVGPDITGRELPQETGQEYALHHNKGCYIGQEIVERIHSRGQVRRCFSGLLVEGPTPESGAKIVAGEKELGEVTSSARVVMNGTPHTVALGYVRQEGQMKPEVMVGSSRATLVPLPFQFS